MTTRPTRFRITAALFIVFGGWSVSVRAQGLAGRVALEGIGSVSTQGTAVDDPSVILDLVSTVRVADGWDIIARPWSMRRPGGDWMFEMYQLQVRYVSATRVPFRVDAGILPSPVGLFTLELQPHRNPLVNAPAYYFAPLPAVDGRFENVRLISGGYPVGAIISTSGSRWDLRGGITDSSPVKPRNAFSRERPAAEAQFVLGGGFTPMTGLRLGVGWTRGHYRPRSGSTTSPSVDKVASVLTVEAEYAFAHTRIAGEWVQDHFEGPSGASTARGFAAQVTQTLTPRLFAAARAIAVSAPVSINPVEIHRTSRSIETTLGYRLTTALTVRGGYLRSRGYNDPHPHDACTLSLVWSDRWW